jgi:hypothetical protein
LPLGQTPEGIASISALDDELFRNLRLIDTDCPDDAVEAYCYMHGFDGFVEFRELWDRLLGFEQGWPRGVEELSRWRFSREPLLGLSDHIHATYRLVASDEVVAVIFAPGFMALIPQTR